MLFKSALLGSVLLWLFLASFGFLPDSHAAGLNSRFGGTGRALPPSDTVGATASEVGVSSSGAATYSTPIMVPIGTTGVQPKITIDYSSGGGKGPLGFGGSIGGMSVIKPIDFTPTDKFCLNGERLVPVNGGTYGADGTEYRTAMDEFSRVISYGSAGSGPQYFKVWKKSGEILEYGNTAGSFIGAIGRPEARAWALNKLSDACAGKLLDAFLVFGALGGIDAKDSMAARKNKLQPYCPATVIKR